MLVAAAMALDAALGEPRWIWNHLPHPAVLMGRAVQFCDRKFNSGAARRAKGTLCMVVLMAAAAAVGVLISLLGPIAEILCAAILLAQRSLVEHVAQVATGLRRSIEDGRRAVAMIVSRDTGTMDESAVARSAIESAAENLSDGVIAPVFWLAVGGLPGLLVYKLVNTADSTIGYRTERHAAFGWAAARIDDLMNLIPARLTALLIILRAWLWKDLAAIRADAARHKSPNAGWPEAAMARALGTALAGPRIYDGVLQDLAWVHATGRKNLSAEDIDESVTMLWNIWAMALFGVIVVL